MQWKVTLYYETNQKQNYCLGYQQKMGSKYKLIKENGFNPFRNKAFENLKLAMLQSEYKSTQSSNLSIKEIAIILDPTSNENTETVEKQDAKIFENYELHISDRLNSHGKAMGKRVIMFNQKEFIQKYFDQVYQSQDLFDSKEAILNEIIKDQQPQSNTTKLIIHLTNSRSVSEQLIIGHNQTQEEDQHQGKHMSLLNEIYNHMNESKSESVKSQIYLSVIGIQKENRLYDLLNEGYLEKQSILPPAVPLVKVRKIGPDIDSVHASNLRKQTISDNPNLKTLIQLSSKVKNQIQYYQNFNDSFFIGELYHFYETSENYDILKEYAVLKINQNFPKLSSQGLEDGFYERRMKEDNSSRISSLLMRIGLNINSCKKNKLRRQQEVVNGSKLSKVEMHQSKILLYLSPIFMNVNTSYVLINQIGAGQQLEEEVKKFELNRHFREESAGSKLNEKYFYHIKHYLDNKQVKQLLQRTAIKFTYDQDNLSRHNRSKMVGKSGHHSENHILLSGQEQNYEQSYNSAMRNKMFNKTATQRTFQNKSKRRVSLFQQHKKVESKSFFCPTISSAERNYWKSIERQDRKFKKVQDNIGEEEQQSNIINEKGDTLRFVDDKELLEKKLKGIRISYKRKLIVMKLSKPMLIEA